jgi:hypothetical protein
MRIIDELKRSNEKFTDEKITVRKIKVVAAGTPVISDIAFMTSGNLKKSHKEQDEIPEIPVDAEVPKGRFCGC